jgi:hypothetical protein
MIAETAAFSADIATAYNSDLIIAATASAHFLYSLPDGCR